MVLSHVLLTVQFLVQYSCSGCVAVSLSLFPLLLLLSVYLVFIGFIVFVEKVNHWTYIGDPDVIEWHKSKKKQRQLASRR